MENISIGRIFGAEFVGTVLVMLGGPGLLILGGELSPLAIAFGFGASMAIAIGVIGAVANPMFSLALWFARAIPSRELVGDVVGQLAGGIVGGFVIYALNNTTRFELGTVGWAVSNGTDEGVDLGLTTGRFAEMGSVIAAELLIGTILVTVLVGAIREQKSNATVAAFVGSAYGLCTLFLLHMSGAGINPARALGTAVFADTDPSALAQVWPFLVFPVVSAFAGVMIWIGIDDDTIDDTIFDDTIVEDATDLVTGD